MIDELTAFVANRWVVWFPAELTPRLIPIVLVSGPAWRRRAVVFFATSRSRRPRVVVKVSRDRDGQDALTREYENLLALDALVTAGSVRTWPRALDLRRWPHAVAVATEVVPGRRPVVPHLAGPRRRLAIAATERFYRRVFASSQELETMTDPSSSQPARCGDMIERFATSLHPDADLRVALTSFQRAIGRADISVRPCWQHGDVTVGNVLYDRGLVRLVDWEHASPASPAWRDLAYAPAALALLAHRQMGGDVRGAATQVLRAGAWTETVLKRELVRRWHYDLPVGWAVTLTVLETALQRGRVRSRVLPWVMLASLLLGNAGSPRFARWLAPRW